MSGDADLLTGPWEEVDEQDYASPPRYKEILVCPEGDPSHDRWCAMCFECPDPRDGGPFYIGSYAGQKSAWVAGRNHARDCRTERAQAAVHGALFGACPTCGCRR